MSAYSSALHRHLGVVAIYFYCLVGFLGYVLFVPLVTMIRAGSPVYEWFLYLGLALLGTVSTTCAALRLRGSRLAVAVGLVVSTLTFLMGVYVGAVFIGTPLLLMALLGYGVVLLSLYAMAVLVIALRSTRTWLDGGGDRWTLIALVGLVLLIGGSWNGFGHAQVLNSPTGRVRLSFWGGWDATRLPDDVLTALRDVDATVYVFTGEKSLDADVRDQFRRAMERFDEYDVEVDAFPLS